MRRWRSRAAVLLALALALSAAAAQRAGTTDSKYPWHGCVRKADNARIVSMRTKDGVRLAGVIFGKGPRGVVLAHESDADLCHWAPVARLLARQGYQALAFDFRNYSLSAKAKFPKNLNVTADVATATQELRRRGAKSVVLVGASMGATVSVVSGASIKPPVSGIVSLSGARTFVRLNAEAAARRLQAPALFVASELDSGYADEARALFAADPAADKRVEIVPDGNHGVALLDAPAVRALVLTWIAEHSAGRPGAVERKAVARTARA